MHTLQYVTSLQRLRGTRGKRRALCLEAAPRPPTLSLLEKAEPVLGPAPAPTEAPGGSGEALTSTTEEEGGSPSPKGEPVQGGRCRDGEGQRMGCPKAGHKGLCSQGQAQQPPMALVPLMTPSASL